MRLKADMEKLQSVIKRAKQKAKRANDTEAEYFYSGVITTLEWVMDKRESKWFLLLDNKYENE